MNYSKDSPEGREFGALGVGLILYSVLFVAILAYGWFHIVSGTLNSIVAQVIALVMALLAWTLAKIVGGNERGIRGNKALFLALLILSAIGVFNTLMIKLEGKAVFMEAIDESVKRFNGLPGAVRKAADNKEVEAFRAQIDGLRTQLEQEINNPRNCGDGPEANKILSDLRVLLPGFIRYSGNARDCENNAEIVRMYSQQIDKLMYGSAVFIKANVRAVEELERTVSTQVPQEIAQLEQLRKEVNSGAGPSTVRPVLEDSASAYQALVLSMGNVLPSVNSDASFRAELDIETARNLGEWGHLVPLFLSRMDKAQTWVYLGIAVFLDWLLVHLFFRIAAHRRAMPTARRPGPSAPSITSPW